MKRWMGFVALALSTLWAGSSWAQVSVSEAWVRATVAQQKATGAFMQLQSVQDARLVAAQSSVAAVVEIHEMAMEGGVMKMRAVKDLLLPAGQKVALKPGGYHVMLMDLKKPIAVGEAVPLTLVVQGKDGQRQSLQVQATARGMGAQAAQDASAKTGHEHHKH